MTATIRVWEVLVDTDGEGPMGDGTVIVRFKSERAATEYASGQTCYGRPATACVTEPPRRIAARWSYHS